MTSPVLVSIVAPFRNEGAVVDEFHRVLAGALGDVPDASFEIVCVDDGSTDDTLARLVRIAGRDPRVRVLELSRPFGKEAALTAGIEAATGDAVIPIDGDLQDPPALIPRLVAEWRNGADVVLARRAERSGDTFAKRTSARFFYRLHNRISPLRIPENVGDYRLMDRDVVEALKRLPERNRFMKGLFAWLGFRTVVVDYRRAPRTGGRTKFSGWKLWNFALDGLTSFSSAPLTLWTYLGGLGALASAIYACWIIVKTLIWGVDVPGYASLIVAILFMGSVQLIGIGVLGEYIGRLYLEAKQRPVYLVRREYRARTTATEDGEPVPAAAVTEAAHAGEAADVPLR